MMNRWQFYSTPQFFSHSICLFDSTDFRIPCDLWESPKYRHNNNVNIDIYARKYSQQTNKKKEEKKHEDEKMLLLQKILWCSGWNLNGCMLLGKSQLIKKSVQKMITHARDLSNDELCFVTWWICTLWVEANTHKKTLNQSSSFSFLFVKRFTLLLKFE